MKKSRELTPYLRKSILLSSLSTFIWAETVTLAPIDIYETGQSSGTIILSEEEATFSSYDAYYHTYVASMVG